MKVIDELIEGVGLLVPEGFDQFDVNSGGLPNGDDSIIVRGNVSQTYRAFVDVSGVVPDFTSLAPTSPLWSLSMWLKLGATSDLGTPSTAAFMLGVMSQNAVTGPFNYNAPFPVNGRASWRICAGGTNDVGFGATWKTNATTYRRTYKLDTLSTGDWHLYVVRSGDPCAVAIDDNGFNNGSADSGAFTSPYVVSNRLSIGNPADAGGHDGRPGEWEIGKICFHDNPLDDDDVQLLYDAMVG